MDDATVFDLIPAYALGALDEAERTQVEAVLTRSEAARQLLLEYEQMLGGLALTVPERRAPDGSTDAFMARLKQVDRDTHQFNLSPEQKNLLSMHKRGEVARRLPRWLLAAAALVILVAGFGLWRLIVGSQLTELARINAIKSDPAVRVVALKPTDPNATSTLNVVLYGTPTGTEAVLDRQALPVLPTGKQYQLWLIPTDQSPVGLAAFDPAPANTPDQSAVLVHLPGPIGNYQTAALTIEPSGGSLQPTTKPIAVANIPPSPQTPLP